MAVTAIRSQDKGARIGYRDRINCKGTAQTSRLRDRVRERSKNTGQGHGHVSEDCVESM